MAVSTAQLPTTTELPPEVQERIATVRARTVQAQREVKRLGKQTRRTGIVLAQLAADCADLGIDFEYTVTTTKPQEAQ